MNPGTISRCLAWPDAEELVKLMRDAQALWGEDTSSVGWSAAAGTARRRVLQAEVHATQHGHDLVHVGMNDGAWQAVGLALQACPARPFSLPARAALIEAADRASQAVARFAA